MEIVSKKDLDLRNAKKLKVGSFESNLYVKDEYLYKMFKMLVFYRYGIERLRDKEIKVNILSDVEIPEIIKPSRIVKPRKIIEGLEMPYIKNTTNLYSFFEYSRDISEYLKVVSKTSKVLKTIHDDPRDIVVCDMNFDNIMFDSEYNIYFCDSDSYSVSGIPSTSIGKSLDIYCKNRSLSPKSADIRYDNFQMFINFLQILFAKYIEHITTEEYERLCDEVSSLRNMRKYFYKTLKSVTVPEVPYLHELIDDADFDSVISYQMPKLYCKSKGIVDHIN
ncbi:MAG: hypothetical protein J1F35_00020 [Erysipelotrichales bacterium]|nr:hypothetical protein [Erysipelotrichales bacterium]